MRETPILYSTEMVLADLEHRKSVTRRTRGLERPNASPRRWQLLSIGWDALTAKPFYIFLNPAGIPTHLDCPYGSPGDRLWIREGLCSGAIDGVSYAFYLADKTMVQPKLEWRWQKPILPSMFMPKEACRLTHTILSVRPERLQEITPWDIVAEGCPFYMDDEDGSQVTEWYSDLWDSLNAKRGYSWESNPWVWQLEYDPDEGLELIPEVKERLLAAQRRPKEELISMGEIRKKLHRRG